MLDGDAERALIASCYCGGRAAVEQALEAGATIDDFNVKGLALQFGAMVRLVDAEKHVDILTVVEELMTHAELDAAGGAAACAQLSAWSDIDASVIDQKARMVMEHAAFRRVSEASQIIGKSATDRDMPAVELMALAQETFLHLNERAQGAAEIVDRHAAIIRVVNSAGKSAPGAVPTGFPGIDEHFRGGLRPGNLHLIAGRPGMAKTAFALAIAGNVADYGVPVGFVSLEVPADDLIEREIASVANASPKTWGRRDESARVVEAAAKIDERPIFIVDKAGLTIAEVCAQGRRMRARHGIGLFIIDHIGKIRPGDRYAGDKNNEVGEISEALRTLASHLGIPVVALSQLNRKVEDRPNKRPIIPDLRDSGRLEEDAYSILFPFRPEYYLKENCPEAQRQLCEVEIAKNRGGAVGTVNLFFDAASSRFAEWSAPC
jgi:replicative DNA helicase